MADGRWVVDRHPEMADLSRHLADWLRYLRIRDEDAITRPAFHRSLLAGSSRQA